MSITYIGATLSVSTSTPAAEDVSSYSALSWVEIGKVISIAELGDESEDVTFDLLKTGRRSHVNGVKDLGEVSVVMEYDKDDTGQGTIRTNNNSNTTLSFRVTDPDGVDDYFQGVVANYKTSERTASNYKGASFMVRGQTGLTTDET